MLACTAPNVLEIPAAFRCRRCYNVADRKKVRIINGSGFYFFSFLIARFPRLIFESGLDSVKYGIQKQFKFGSGLDSEKYGRYQYFAGSISRSISIFCWANSQDRDIYIY